MSESFPDFEAPAAERDDTRDLWDKLLAALDDELSRRPVVTEPVVEIDPVFDTPPRRRQRSRSRCCCCCRCGG